MPTKKAAKKGTKKSAKKGGKKGAKKSSKKGSKKNKLGVRNSLVNNINARKKKGKSRSKKKSTVSKESYGEMETGWRKNK